MLDLDSPSKSTPLISVSCVDEKGGGGERKGRERGEKGEMGRRRERRYGEKNGKTNGDRERER